MKNRIYVYAVVFLLGSSSVNGQEIFAPTTSIGAISSGVGIFTNTPLPNFFDVAGDVRLNSTGVGDGVFFSLPNAEQGMTIFRGGGLGRADLRFDGNYLKLVTGLSAGGPPNQFNGLMMGTDGRIGLATFPSGSAQLAVDASHTSANIGIYSTIINAFNGTGFGVYAKSEDNNDNTGVRAEAVRGDVAIGVHGTANDGIDYSYGGKFNAENSRFSIGVEGRADINVGIPSSSAHGGDFDARGGANFNCGIKANAEGTSTVMNNMGTFSSAYGKSGNTHYNYGTFSSGYSGAGTDQNYGVYAYADATDNGSVSSSTPGTFNCGLKAIGLHDKGDGARNYGVYAEGRIDYTGGAPYNYGIYAVTPHNHSNVHNYAVFGDAGGNGPGWPVNDAWAGYFNGDTYSPGAAWTSSDIKLKKEIETLGNALEKIALLKPKTYQFRTDEFKSINFRGGEQIGLIAQDLEKVFPNLVRLVHHPAVYDSTGKKIYDGVDFKAVDYTSLIPVLIAGIQEQQAIILDNETKINELEERIKRQEQNSTSNIHSNAGSTDAALYQNTPNPFSKETTIRYSLPANQNSGTIWICDFNGKKIKEMVVTERTGSITFTAENLPAGIYLYSLIVNGQEIMTKKMVFNP